MLAFAIISKKGPPRYIEFPLLTKEQAEDERSAVYTAIEDYSEHTRASSMSRMSISLSGSRTGSKTPTSAIGGHEDSDERSPSGTDIVTPIPIDDDEQPPPKRNIVKSSEALGGAHLGVSSVAGPATFEKPPPSKTEKQTVQEVEEKQTNTKETSKSKEEAAANPKPTKTKPEKIVKAEKVEPKKAEPATEIVSKENQKASSRKVGSSAVKPTEPLQQNGIPAAALPKVDKTKGPAPKQVKEEAKTLMENHVKNLKESIKPLEKNPLPPIDNSSVRGNVA